MKSRFPIENRVLINEVQVNRLKEHVGKLSSLIFILSTNKDFSALGKYMKQFPKLTFLEAMKNFHLLLFLATNEAIPFDVIFSLYLFLKCLIMWHIF